MAITSNQVTIRSGLEGIILTPTISANLLLLLSSLGSSSKCGCRVCDLRYRLGSSSRCGCKACGLRCKPRSSSREQQQVRGLSGGLRCKPRSSSRCEVCGLRPTTGVGVKHVAFEASRGVAVGKGAERVAFDASREAATTEARRAGTWMKWWGMVQSKVEWSPTVNPSPGRTPKMRTKAIECRSHPCLPHHCHSPFCFSFLIDVLLFVVVPFASTSLLSIIIVVVITLLILSCNRALSSSLSLLHPHPFPIVLPFPHSPLPLPFPFQSVSPLLLVLLRQHRRVFGVRLQCLIQQCPADDDAIAVPHPRRHMKEAADGCVRALDCERSTAVVVEIQLSLIQWVFAVGAPVVVVLQHVFKLFYKVIFEISVR
ncbi:hypothetical protein ACLOJK_013001 [Asimina triloba]